MVNEEKKLEQFTPFTHEEFYKRYYVHRVAATTVVVNKDNKVLLAKEIRRGKYVWGLPGGLIERQESIIKGLQREVLEETSCEIKPYAILAMTNWAGKSIFENDTRTQSGFLIILASEYISGTPKPDGEEVFETNFFGVDEFDALNVHPSIKKFVQAIQEKKFIPLHSSNFQNEDDYRFNFSPT